MQDSQLQDTIIEAIRDRKGREITIIDLSGIEYAGSPNLIICQGSSTSNVGAIADNIRDQVLANTSRKPYNYDGYQNCQWIVIDYGEVMVHVFLPDARKYYDLEQLWADAPSATLPDLD